jgi:inhibitor of KinA sporulation pathway (predicted exonuclease)
MQSEVSIHKLKRKSGLFKHPVDFIDLRALMYYASKQFNEFTVPNYVTLIGMLRVMELEPEGNAHSGIDDASNLARVAVRLLEQGYDLAPNAKW